MLRHPYVSEQRHCERKREVREAIRHQRYLRNRRSQRRVRRLVGRSMVSIGSRLAAEPSHEGARSR